MSEVELLGIRKSFGQLVVVDGLNLSVRAGEFVTLLGPSGCGKTTVLRIIAGLARPDSGKVMISGRVMNDIPVHLRGLGLVAQNYSLFPHMTTLENVAFGLQMRRVATADVRRRVRQALAMVGLTGLEDRYPRQLSGGQQQRVALARAIVVEPAVLLLDEPLAALDKKLRASMQVELRSLQRQLGITVVFVTHDQEEALTMSDRIAVLYQGRLEQFGTPQEIYETPQTLFVADFIGVCNFFEGVVVARSSDQVVVKTASGLLLHASRGEGTMEGHRVVATIRPEKITLQPKFQSASNRVLARLETAVYLGTTVHYHLRLPGGERLVAYRQNDSAAPSPALTVDAEVAASWDVEAVRIVVSQPA